MNSPYVSCQMNFLNESFPTFLTLEWPLPSVGPLMIPELGPFRELSLTVFADMLAFPFVPPGNMILEILFVVEALTTNCTQVWPLSCVCSNVLLPLLSFYLEPFLAMFIRAKVFKFCVL